MLFNESIMETTQPSDKKPTRLQTIWEIAKPLGLIAGLVWCIGAGIRCENRSERLEAEEQAKAQRVADEQFIKEQTARQTFYDGEFNESKQPVFATVLEDRANMQVILKTEQRDNYQREVVHQGVFSRKWGDVNRPIEVKVPATESTYVIKVRTEPYLDRGTNPVPSEILSVQIVDGRGLTKQQLESLIDTGTKISFPRGNLVEYTTNRMDWAAEAEKVHNYSYAHYDFPGEPARYGYAFGEGDWLKPGVQGAVKPAGQIKVLTDNLLIENK